MKKIYMILLPALMLVSCSKEFKMTTYPGGAGEAFFEDTEYSYAVSGDLADSYTIDVYRANPSGDAEVGIEISVDDKLDGVFSAPKTVKFADGKYESSVTVSFDRSKLDIRVKNSVSVKLKSETKLPYDTECTLVVMRDYTWKAYAKGTYTSAFLTAVFEETKTWKQELEVAEENAKLYRFKDLYHNAGTKYTKAGYHMEIIWDGASTTVKFVEEADEDGIVEIASGFIHPSLGMFYLGVDSSPEYTGYDPADKTFTFNGAIWISSQRQVTDWGDETYKITEIL